MEKKVYRVIKHVFNPREGQNVDTCVEFVEGNDSLIRNYVRAIADHMEQHEIQHGKPTPEGTCVVDSRELDRGGNTVRAIRVQRLDKKDSVGDFVRTCDIIAETFYIKPQASVERFVLATYTKLA